jgi:hypothetical protein
MRKTFKYRLYPTKQQQRLLNQQMEEVARAMKTSVEYRALPAKGAQWAQGAK